ncbi:MAG: endonuclease/exonuclease/phosphatase family protein [Alphaproteobacteria bacterium]|nr:endonuclease/exonuclease/phosphatase family protein [Alphaproteobacteria bacterium]
MRIKIIFANVIQGMIHLGYNDRKENIFAGFHPEKYVDFFADEEPDILCLAECLMDKPDGTSEFVEKISQACQLPYYKNLKGEKAFFVADKFYGLSICTKFPITEYQTLKLANPQIETVRPNGEHWFMHDKYIQKANLQISADKNVCLINTHMFPFQHFNRHFWDSEFAAYREQWAKMLIPEPNLSFITGDFNTVDIAIEQAFPELQIGEKLHSLVAYDGKKYQPQYPYNTQIEYILATPDIKLLAAHEKMLYSDHPFLIAEVEI